MPALPASTSFNGSLLMTRSGTTDVATRYAVHLGSNAGFLASDELACKMQRPCQLFGCKHGTWYLMCDQTS